MPTPIVNIKGIVGIDSGFATQGVCCIGFSRGPTILHVASTVATAKKGVDDVIPRMKAQIAVAKQQVEMLQSLPGDGVVLVGRETWAAAGGVKNAKTGYLRGWYDGLLVDCLERIGAFPVDVTPTNTSMLSNPGGMVLRGKKSSPPAEVAAFLESSYKQFIHNLSAHMLSDPGGPYGNVLNLTQEGWVPSKSKSHLSHGVDATVIAIALLASTIAPAMMRLRGPRQVQVVESLYAQIINKFNAGQPASFLPCDQASGRDA